MVQLNTSNHEYGHICMYNGKQWYSDFIQNTIKTYEDWETIPTYFFRYNPLKEENDENISDGNQYISFKIIYIFLIFILF